jgi:ADP-ribosyl-[dinitrogen reductase] hydrolase
MNPTTEERFAGAVWGHLVGDALGVPYEFSVPGTVSDVRWGATGTHGQPPGTWSDDGGLMLSLLDSLLHAGFDLEDQGRRALAWYETDAYRPGPLFDIGITTSRAFDRLKRGTPAAEAGGRGERDNGNGSLMRILPIALVDPRLASADLVQRAAAASKLTHGHPRSQVACAVYCAIARRLLQGEEDPGELLPAAMDDVRRAVGSELGGELANLIGYEIRTGDGYVLDSFWSAWAVFASSDGYQAAVERAVRLGNDTDTTACLAGGLAGLRWGVASIPAEWHQSMRGREIVEPLISELVRRWSDA